jgi:hypothetical protein
MFLNIVTPCSRPENLLLIEKSINIPKENYRWIVVFDGNILPNKELIPESCEIYLHTNEKSIVGHSQRNHALDLINDGYVYFNDDDTTIHKDLWKNIKNLDCDFISFQQQDKNGHLRLFSKQIAVGTIDSHNFIVNRSIIGETRFIIDKYEADGFFAVDCYQKSKNICYINKVLSTYNSLR